MYDTIKTIRYMGNKNKLLDFIIPELLKNTDEKDVICELMAGTNCISYALKKHRQLLTNDIQYYSYIISKALISNNSYTISSESANNDLYESFKYNINKKTFDFFKKNYSDTYFSKQQCIEIDSIRYAISKVQKNELQCLYLVALMHAMCVCQSTSGHFAQYLPVGHPRLVKIRKKSIWYEFTKKCDDFNSIVFNNYNNKCFNLHYAELFKTEDFKKVKLVYIDPPYTGEQYSRFYHVLETICKYDNPKLAYKGLYRTDRYTSPFSLRTKAFDEFDNLFKLLSQEEKTIVLSYSTKGILKEYEMEYLIKKHYKHCEIKRTDYNHSTQGKGNINIEELLYIAKK